MKHKTLSLVAVLVLLFVLAVGCGQRGLPSQMAGGSSQAQVKLDQAAAQAAAPAQRDEGEEAANGATITDDQAIAIARKAIGDVHFDQQGTIQVGRLAGRICVVFPVSLPKPPPGMVVKGPDYAAKVYIDAQSGKVVEFRRGS